MTKPDIERGLTDSCRVFMFYPPGALYQRGEDRCQGNISDSTATAIRAPNDMGYLAAVLKKKDCEIFFRDYQTEGRSLERLEAEFAAFAPSVAVVSATNATIREDIRTAARLKRLKPDVFVILKGTIFFQPHGEVFSVADFSVIDCLAGAESEFIVPEIVDRWRSGGPKALSTIRGLTFRHNGEWINTGEPARDGDLNSLPYPDRSIINNNLYRRPDTGTPQATITASSGCPAACIYCLSPAVSGKQLRCRTPQNILGELRECYHKFGISDFFFRSDTFTLDADWVGELCREIGSSELSGKISWAANSRAKPLAEGTLKAMREAGCWLVAFGFESGSEESLRLMKKGATVADNLRAARLAREAGLEIFGFYMLGFPWEDWSHLAETKRHIYEINADYIEVHLAIPYPGTELYGLAQERGLLDSTAIGRDYFNPPVSGTAHIPAEQLLKYRRNLLLKYHMRPTFLSGKLLKAAANPNLLKSYAAFAMRLLKNSFCTESKGS